jgi:hypothetical protein
MSRKPTKTAMHEDGLHFKTKAGGGSPIASPSYLGSMKSCILCGKHRPINELKNRNIFGKFHAVCTPKCQ